MKNYPWFRMYAEAVDDDKLRLLAYEDRWHFVALLCIKTQGVLDEPNPELRLRRIGVKLGLASLELEAAMDRLTAVGLIDRDTWEPIKWEERQYKSDSVDPTAADRMRRFRERKKAATDEIGVTVTRNERNDTAIDTESDGESDADTDTEKEAFPSAGRLNSESEPSKADPPTPIAPRETVTVNAQKFATFILEIKATYPKAARESWIAAERAIRRVIENGAATCEEIQSGVERYAAYCKHTKSFVQNPLRFFEDIDRPWLSSWAIPDQKTKGMKPAPNDTAAWAEAKALAKEIGFRAPHPGQSVASYATDVKAFRDRPAMVPLAERRGLSGIKRFGAT